MGTPNEDLAAQSGQDATYKEPLDAERSKSGEYADDVKAAREAGTLLPGSQPASTVSPLGGTK